MLISEQGQQLECMVEILLIFTLTCSGFLALTANKKLLYLDPDVACFCCDSQLSPSHIIKQVPTFSLVWVLHSV
jgi:hypothetical protein